MTDILLVAIEALTADDIYDRQMGSNVLDMAMSDPASWLMDVSALWLDCPAHEPCQALFFPRSLTQLSRAPDAISRQQRGMGRAAVSVAAWEMAALQWQHHPHLCPPPLQVPKIMRCIHRNMEYIRTEPARHSLDSLLLLLTKWCPRGAVRSLLKISPACDRYCPDSLEGLFPVGRGAQGLSGCQTHGKLQDIPEEPGPPSHHASQPQWVSQARSSQSWPSQSPATTLLPAPWGTPPQPPPACLGRAPGHPK